MGAIAGVILPSGNQASRVVLDAQANTLKRRGEQKQYFEDRNAGLVHCYNHNWQRDAGFFASAGHRYAMVCNGVIFNWQSIRDKLLERGIGSKDSDCAATLVSAFSTWGSACFSYFNGGFCIAIWDKQENVLTLARDPCGIKQLFYWGDERKIVFATEVKAVLADREIKQNPDEVGIANYLACNRYLFRDEHTFYEGVKRIPAGHCLQISSGGAHKEQYWFLNPRQPDFEGSDEERIEYIRELMLDAVRIRMPQGNNISAALSGGFDSSSIVCAADYLNRTERAGSASLDTFSFDFNSDDADEVELIKLVAKKTNASHHHIDALRDGLFDDVDDMIFNNDGPLLESSVLLMWNKKQVVKNNGGNILLSGLGGDEVFMGTLHYFADLFSSLNWVDLMRSLRSVYPVDLSTGTRTSLTQLLRAYLVSPLMPHWLRRIKGTSHGVPFPPPWLDAGVARRAAVASAVPPQFTSGYRSAYDTHNFDLFYYELVGGAVPYQDVCGGAWDVDTRFPLLDKRLVEAMFAMHRRWKLDGRNIRLMQKSAMSPYLPKEILQDHLKKNFHHVLHRYTQRHYKQEVQDLLKNKQALSRKYLHWPTLEKYSIDFINGKNCNPGPLWLAVNLEKWLNNFQR